MPRKNSQSNMADSKSSKKLFNKKNISSRSKKTTLNKLRDELDYWFGRYVRVVHCDCKQVVKCFTCDKEMQLSESRAGHFVSRKYMATRWDCDNVRPQCHGCDRTMQGMQWEFGRRLDQEQENKAAEIVARSKSRANYTHGHLRSAITYYSSEVERITRDKNIIWTKHK